MEETLNSVTRRRDETETTTCVSLMSSSVSLNTVVLRGLNSTSNLIKGNTFPLLLVNLSKCIVLTSSSFDPDLLSDMTSLVSNELMNKDLNNFLIPRQKILLL